MRTYTLTPKKIGSMKCKARVERALMKCSASVFNEAAVKAGKRHLTKTALILPAQRAANKRGRRIGGLRGSPLLPCLLLVLAARAGFVRFFRCCFFLVVFFYDAICATTRKTGIVRALGLPLRPPVSRRPRRGVNGNTI